jgi:hypothetical protein
LKPRLARFHACTNPARMARIRIAAESLTKHRPAPIPEHDAPDG